MRKLCVIFMISTFFLAFLVRCGSVQTRSELTKARRGAEKAYRNVSQRADSQHFCILGIRAGADGLVLQVGTHAEENGILPGDKILAVDGGSIKNWMGGKEELRKHSPDETITLRLLRNGKQIDRRCRCLDIADTATATAAALREGADGNWLGCVQRMEDMQEKFSPSPVAQNILVDCYKYYLISEGKKPDDSFASALVKLAVLNIEEASSSGEALQKLEDDVTAQVEWLKRNHFPQRADALQLRYDAAVADLKGSEKQGSGNGMKP